MTTPSIKITIKGTDPELQKSLHIPVEFVQIKSFNNRVGCPPPPPDAFVGTLSESLLPRKP
jgi:hypothetical protein